MKAQMHNYSSYIDDVDSKRLKEIFTGILKNAGFTIESFQEKHFQPYGYTCLFLLSESHFAIHTFPEENQTYIELSSCVKKQFNMFLHLLYNYEQSI